MGIRDRRYMSRQPDDDFERPRGPRNTSPPNVVEVFFRRQFRRHPKLYTCLGLGVVLFVVAGVIVAKLTATK